MKPPRGLSPDEAALWKRVAATVEPMQGRRAPPLTVDGVQTARPQASLRKQLPLAPLRQPVAPAPAPSSLKRPAIENHTLDGGWDRRLGKGAVQPDFTLDLHGCTLDAAHARLDHGLTLALQQGARVVLLITGRPRPSSDHASRSERRGAIRAKFLDWLISGSHAARIAAVRPAHPRHGGAGAVYVVLKRGR